MSGFKSKKWDKHNSTFMHIILMDNGMEFTGYTKRMGCNERNDKNSLLSNLILRLYDNGYLDRNNPEKTKIQYVDIFHRPTGEHILRLRYNYFEQLSTIVDSDEFKALKKFLDLFYKMVNENTPSSEIYNKLYVTSRSKRIADPFDLSIKRFQNSLALQHYCVDLRLSNKVENAGIESFARKYLEKYLPDVNITEWIGWFRNLK